MSVLFTVAAVLWLGVVACLCWRMAQLHRQLASAYWLIAALIPEDDAARRVALSETERASR